MSDLTYGTTRIPARRMWFYAAGLGVSSGGLVLLSLLEGDHPFGASLTLSAVVGGLVSGWIVLLCRLADRYLAGRLAHASFVFATGALLFGVAVLPGAEEPRLLVALITLPVSLCAAVSLFVRSV